MIEREAALNLLKKYNKDSFQLRHALTVEEKPVRKGELLTRDNATPDRTTRLFALRERQDRMLDEAVPA